MSTNFKSAKSLIDEMLTICADNLERDMRRTIENQLNYYKLTREKTISKMLGKFEDEYSLVQQFKYLATVRTTLQEMETTFLEYFGKAWDYVEPTELPTELPTEEKPKRGRPRKS